MKSGYDSTAAHFLPEYFGDHQWGAMFTDVELWTPAIGRVWQVDPLPAAVTGIPLPTAIRSGFPGTCAVFIVNESAVVKFFPPFAHEDFRRERYLLTNLAATVTLLPPLLAAGILADRIDWPYLVMQFEPGLVWRDHRNTLSRENRLSIASELGKVIRQLHAIPVPSGPDWPCTDFWDAFIEIRLHEISLELARQTALPDAVISEAAELLHAFNLEGRTAMFGPR